MVEQDKVFESKIKQTGIWDFKETYRVAYDWLVDNGYHVSEDSYSEKINPTGKEIEIKWKAERKISDYFRNLIKVAWRILGMVEVEVEKNGKKVKMNKGYIEMKATGILEKDYEHKWERSPFTKFLRTVYDRYVIKRRIEFYEDKLFEELDEFITQIKSFLAIEGITS